MKLYEINNRMIAEEFLLLERQAIKEVESVFKKIDNLVKVVKQDAPKLKLGVVEILFKKAEEVIKKIYNEYSNPTSIRDVLINTEDLAKRLTKIKEKIEVRLNEILEVRFNKELIFKIADLIQRAVKRIEEIVDFVNKKNKAIMSGLGEEVVKQVSNN